MTIHSIDVSAASALPRRFPDDALATVIGASA